MRKHSARSFLKSSLNHKDVSSTKPKAPFFPPKPENVSQPTADSHLLRTCHRTGDLALIEKAWLGSFVSANTQTIFKQIGPVGFDFGWSCPLTAFTDSAVCVLPGHVQKFTGSDDEHFVFDVKTKSNEPTLRSIVGLKDLRARAYVWRAWPWQCDNLKDYKKLKPATRLVLNGPEEGIDKALARV